MLETHQQRRFPDVRLSDDGNLVFLHPFYQERNRYYEETICQGHKFQSEIFFGDRLPKMSTVKILTADIVGKVKEEGVEIEKVLEKGVEIDVDRDIVAMWTTLSHLLQYEEEEESRKKEDKELESKDELGSKASLEEPEESVPLPNVTHSTLEKVIEYCRHQIDDPDDVEWGQSFFHVPSRKDASLETVQARIRELACLAEAASYLNIEDLSTHTCAAIADTFENKTPEEIREEHELPDDLTDEEKAQIKRENEWCLEL